MTTTRTYRMGARGDAVAATRARILDAVIGIAYDALDFEPTLDAVAGRAGVSVRTVLRHFSNREELLDAATDRVLGQVLAERRPLAPDVDSALDALLEHYEIRGDFTVVMLAREGVDRRVEGITRIGKREHRAWAAAVFAAGLASAGDDREALLDLLVVATDVYAWKLLRRDRAHPIATVHARMRAMTDALVGPCIEGTGEEEPCAPR